MSASEWAPPAPTLESMSKAADRRTRDRDTERTVQRRMRELESARNALDGLEATDEWSEFLALAQSLRKEALEALAGHEGSLRSGVPLTSEQVLSTRLQVCLLNCRAQTIAELCELPERFRKAVEGDGETGG